jgi:hypothetical protein
MAQKTAAQAASNWKTGMAAAGPKWSAGIAACNVNPMQLAAAAVDKATANYVAAAPQMVAQLNATPVGFWKSQAAAAAGSFAQGATKGLPKYTSAVAKLAGTVWPGQKQASMSAGGGAAGMVAAYQYVQQAKASGQTK